MKLASLIAGTILCTGLFGCAAQQPNMDYSAFMESNPHSIVVLMPTSVSTDINAAPAVLASAVLPLAEAGYYVFPVTMVNDTFRYNGLTEAEEIRNVPVRRLKEVFGADAVMYLTVNDYQTHYTVLDSYTQVSVNAVLRDTSNGRVLWEGTATTNNKSGGTGNILGDLVAGLVKKIVNEATSQGFEIAKSNSYTLFSTDEYVQRNPLLNGPYSKEYRQDDILDDLPPAGTGIVPGSSNENSPAENTAVSATENTSAVR